MAFTALMYHSLSDGRCPDTLYAKYSTRLATFRDHLRALLDAGFELCSFRELIELHDSALPLPERTCALTFDDGHRSSLDLADAMRDAGVSGTFFLTSGYCRERAEFLKEGEIRALAAEGFDFGTHGVTHRPLRCLPREEMRRELAGSKAWLEGVLGKPVASMSLPAGQGGRAVRREAFTLGYRLIGNSRESANGTLRIPGEVNRLVVLSSHTGSDVLRVAAALPAYVWKRRIRAAALWLPKRILRPYARTRDAA
jgi:peptidoglycan/xylan/chitin deacetylase (PgdA/CDA1 family)